MLLSKVLHRGSCWDPGISTQLLEFPLIQPSVIIELGMLEYLVLSKAKAICQDVKSTNFFF